MKSTIVSIAVVACTAIASAKASQGEPFPDDDWSQIARLVPDGPANTGMCGFGWDVDIKEDLAIVSSPWVWGDAHPDFHPPGHVPNTGAAWVFEKQDGIWQQVDLLRSPSAWEEGRFGWSCTIIGEQILIGAPGESSLYAPGPDDPDLSVCESDITGDWVTDQGRIHVYEREANGWSRVQSIQTPLVPQITYCGPDFPALYRRLTGLGFSIGHDGDDLLVVGCPYEWSWVPNSEFDYYETGAVHVFRRNGSDWEHMQALDLGPARREGTAVGFSVDVSPDERFIVAGAGEQWADLDNDGQYDFAGNGYGAAYIFDLSVDTLMYELSQSLTRDDVQPGLAARNIFFGDDVALSIVPNPVNERDEYHLFIGTPGATIESFPGSGVEEYAAGAVDHFVVRDGSSFEWERTIQNPDPGREHWFGEKLDLGSDALLISASGADRDANGDGDIQFDVGASYMYYLNFENIFAANEAGKDALDEYVQWRGRWTGTPSVPQGNIYFGWPAAIDDNEIIAAATGESNCIGAAYIFRNPFPDLDEDGLSDSAEVRGVSWVNPDGTAGTFPLRVGNTGYDKDAQTDPRPVADPWRKDIFIEIDTVDASHINWDALQLVRKAFREAPVGNPSGPDGVALHYTDPANVEVIGGIADPFPYDNAAALAAKSAHFTNPEDFFSHPEAVDEIRQAKLGAYRWAFFAGDIEDDVAGYATAPGEYMVFSGPHMGAIDDRFAASTFMHELGHTLGLDHGGDDEVNFKPNYVSVMNYNFDSIRLLDGSWPAVDFSREVTTTLDEADLDEPFGLTSPEYSDVLMPVPLAPGATGPLSQRWRWVRLDGSPIDWNDNEDPSELGVDADPNYLGAGYTTLGPWATPSPGEILTGHNDWEAPLAFAPVLIELRGDQDDYLQDSDYTVEFLEELADTIPPPPIPCTGADLAEPYNLLDLADITTFITAFVAQDPIADLDDSGLHDLTDITLFVTGFVAGCP